MDTSQSQERLINDGESEAPLLANDYNERDETYQVTSSSSVRGFPARFVVAFWAFLGFLCLYSIRVNLSVAIVAMTVPPHAKNDSIAACPPPNNGSLHSSAEPHLQEEFDWSPQVQGFVLGSFFYGYLLTQIIGGNLAERFGGKWIFGGGIFIAGLLTLLTPMAARLHVGFLIAVRILIGAFEAPAFPSAAALWGRWIPPLERSILPPLAATGKEIGIVLTTPIVSQLCTSNFLGGWPSVFYLTGILSSVWFIGWCFFAFNSPSEHPRISYSEKLFLLRTVPKPKKSYTPWWNIATCVPLYAIAVNHICTNFAFYILLTSLPTYFSSILRFNLQENGIMFAIPYICNLVFTIVSGQIADRIRARRILSTTATRRWQTIIGALGTSIFLILVGHVGCDHLLAVIFISLSIAFMGFQASGSLISHLDIASNYAGTLVGITNMLASVPGFIGPMFVGWMTNNNQTLDAWRSIFNISSGVILFGCLIYCVLFDGEEQSWNRDEDLEQ